MWQWVSCRYTQSIVWKQRESRFDVIEPKEKRFRGQSLVGWILAIIAILFMGSSIIVGAVDGVQNNFTYIQFFIRFLMILLLLKAFDIVFFDWILLCNRGFSFF